jgi:5-methylcytosine-specific restriction endonuclease McrA
MKKPSRKQLVIEYFKTHLGEWIHNQELRNLSGLNDVPRTIRLLRQEGWQINIRGDGHVMLISLEKVEARGLRKAISERVRYEVFSRDDSRCQSCGRGVADGIKLVVDHMLPVDWGGTNEITNLQTLCEECNQGKQAWFKTIPPQNMKDVIDKPTVEQRIEALFDRFPNQEVKSELIRVVSKSALDWQRALRRIRQRTGKKIVNIKVKNAYYYMKDK